MKPRRSADDTAAGATSFQVRHCRTCLKKTRDTPARRYTAGTALRDDGGKIRYVPALEFEGRAVRDAFSAANWRVALVTHPAELNPEGAYDPRDAALTLAGKGMRVSPLPPRKKDPPLFKEWCLGRPRQAELNNERLDSSVVVKSIPALTSSPLELVDLLFAWECRKHLA